MAQIFIGNGTFDDNNECELHVYGKMHVSKDINGNYKVAHMSHELYIFKDANDYDYVEEILEADDVDELYCIIEFHILKNLHYNEFIEAVIHIEQRGFDEGYEKAQKNIREALGIYSM